MRLLAEVKSRFAPRDVDAVSDQLQTTASAAGAYPILIAPYLSPRTREVLRTRGLSHADTAGSLWIAAGPLWIERHGAERDPRPDAAESQMRRSLRGPITGRVIRYLCDTERPPGVREIAAATDVNPGNVSRILELLEHEALIVCYRREHRVLWEDIRWEDLIRRWAVDLAKDRKVRTFLDPRGEEHAIERLRRASFSYALTGSCAAALIAPAAVPAALDVYVASVPTAQHEIGLVDADGVGNVRLVDPFDPDVLDRVMVRDALKVAWPSQVAADLLTLPHRSNEEIDALFAWMAHNVSVWRVR